MPSGSSLVACADSGCTNMVARTMTVPINRTALANPAEAGAWTGPEKAGLLAWSRREKPPQFSAMEVLTPNNDPREAAARLFAAMRRLDAMSLELIVAEPPPAHGLGVAILDRLRKAAAPR